MEETSFYSCDEIFLVGASSLMCILNAKNDGTEFMLRHADKTGEKESHLVCARHFFHFFLKGRKMVDPFHIKYCGR